ncbi:C4-dicarboxylate transporter/malic acid transport protein [Apiospora arundinis]
MREATVVARGGNKSNLSPPSCPEGAAPCASKNDAGWRRIVRNFTPSWFTVTMGTGIVSILLHNLPYNTDWIRWMSVGFFSLNVLLMVAFTTISAMRYILYPQIWSVMIRHPTQSLFLGTFPMGLATIINMTVFVCVPAWGNWAAYLAWGLWWFDLAVSLICCVSLPFLVIHLGKTDLASLTAVMLLPIVPCVVAAASGGIVANVLPNPSHVQTTLIASYMSWGIGIFFSVLVLAMYQVRLSNHALPPREAIVSVLLPVGPFGQGGFGIAKLTQVTRKLLLHGGGEGIAMEAVQEYDTTYAEPIGLLIEGLGACVALIMWGIGLVWLAYAVISIATTRSFPFNMGWWGFTFPLGVWVACTAELGSVLHKTFFDVTAMIGSGCVFLLWLVVAACTTKQVISGEMFFAPCLKNLSSAERLGKKT